MHGIYQSIDIKTTNLLTKKHANCFFRTSNDRMSFKGRVGDRNSRKETEKEEFDRQKERRRQQKNREGMSICINDDVLLACQRTYINRK